VDNDYFATKVAECRTKRQLEVGAQLSGGGRTAKPYFLVSSRFIERKNLRTLVEAYAEYRRRFVNSSPACLRAISPSLGSHHPSLSPWDLVLLGTGDGKEELERYVKGRGVDGVVFPGFQQIDNLPRWYAGAGAFVHPALEEPWGLVINEAMASGLPIICSRTTGAAELIEEGGNGFLFDPRDFSALAALLKKVAGSAEKERALWASRSVTLVNERAPAQAFGRGLKKLLSAT
jgi:glycosyltransferase involved in cell wall biosynthesis